MLSSAITKVSSVQCKVSAVVCIGGGIIIGTWLAGKVTEKVREALALRKWWNSLLGDRSKLAARSKEYPKDVVILHATPRGKLAPHLSPFVLKLETFLRMHKIPCLYDCEFPFNEVSKMPWITLNEEHYDDSQMIIDFLTRKYNLKPGGNYNESERAAGTMARIMADQHIFWGLVLWRYVYANGEQLYEIFNFTEVQIKFFQKAAYDRYIEQAWYHGIGRYSKEQVIDLMQQDFVALSKFLGTKKFLLGDEPCNDDCALFGMIGMFVWNDVKSPFAKSINEELTNLKEYCFRMKKLYWSDWDAVIEAGLQLS